MLDGELTPGQEDQTCRDDPPMEEHGSGRGAVVTVRIASIKQSFGM